MKKLISFIIFVLCLSLSTAVYAGGWGHRGGGTVWRLWGLWLWWWTLWWAGVGTEVVDTMEAIGVTMVMVEATMEVIGVTTVMAEVLWPTNYRIPPP